MANGALTGSAVGTAIMPGPGTVIGGLVGGAVDFFSGGPSAQQHQADIGGRSLDAYQIYQQIKGGPGTGSLEQAGSAAQELQNRHADRAKKIAALNQLMDSAWQGDSSQAAQAGAHPLQTWLDDSAQNLGKSHEFIGNQITDFHTVSSKVQQLPQDPPSKGFVDNFNPWSSADDDINAYNQKGQANVDAFNAYYQTSAQNAAGMPQFQGPGSNPISGPPGGVNPPTGGGGGGGGGNYSGGGGGGYGSGGGHLPHYGTNMPSTHLPGTGGSGSGYGGPGSGGYTPPSYNDGTAAAGYTPPSTDNSSSFGPGGAGGFGPGGGAGTGAGGYGGSGGFGPGGSLATGAVSGAGAASGGTAGAGGPRGGAAAGAGGVAGRPGMSGMGGHGGKGKGEEDEEHETKYLVSEDPNDLFGTDQLTAPPVIGE